MEPLQVLPLQARVDLGVMAIKGYSIYSLKLLDKSLTIRWNLVSYSGYSLGVHPYHVAEMQLVYSATPADRVVCLVVLTTLNDSSSNYRL